MAKLEHGPNELVDLVVLLPVISRYEMLIFDDLLPLSFAHEDGLLLVILRLLNLLNSFQSVEDLFSLMSCRMVPVIRCSYVTYDIL